jgi:hypothetical protein
MHLRFWSLLGLLAAALSAGSLSAESAVAQTVDDLVSRHIDARGGYEKLKAIQTIKITRVVTAFAHVRVIIYKKRPALFRLEQGPLKSDAPLVPRGVNGDTAWDTAPGGKIVPRSEAAGREARDIDCDFDGLLVDWKAKGHAVSLEGQERLPSGGTFKLKVRTRRGAERMIFLDATTYLERRQTGVLNLPGDRQFNVVIDFDNYREVGGVKFAHDINEERTGKEPVQSLVWYTEKIELNVTMDDGLFDR